MNNLRQTVLITGASRGIGAATARLAAARGFDIAINYKSDKASAEEVACECRLLGAKAEIIPGDMAREADITHLFAEAKRLFGRIDHVVNNAGITGPGSRFDEASSETFRSVIDLNVTGALLVARAAVRALSPKHGGTGGTITNLSSAAAGLGSPGEFVWYAASKGAIDSLTIGLSKELAGENIRVNAVTPGIIDTDIHASSGFADRVERLGPMTPMGRAGTAEEIASTILFLISDDASYVTGANLKVTGGR